MGALAVAACGGASDEVLFGEGAGGHGSSSALSPDADSGLEDGATEVDAGSQDRACVPGHSISCACVGGLAGVQQCLSSGEGYGSCDCPDAPDAGEDGDAPTDAGPDGAEEDSGPVDAGPDAPNWGSDGGNVCAPAQCIPKGVTGINCDPDCGPVSSQCSAACDSTKPLTLSPGVTWIRTPPISEKQCAKCASDLNWWALGFQVPTSPHCITAVGPDGSRVFPGGWTSEVPAYPNLCGDWQVPNCRRALEPSPPAGRKSFLTIGIREPTPGALFRIELRMDQSCPEAQCVGGCNGDGALYL